MGGGGTYAGAKAKLEYSKKRGATKRRKHSNGKWGSNR